jgi:carbonic anhydrase
MTPEDALKRLIEGNGRYIQDRSQHPNRNAERREELVAKQEPFAIVLGCSDSRVSPEIIFDQGVGDLFIVRVAGNVVGPIELSSVLFAAQYLHSSLIFVLGHENCGAVQAVLENNTAGIEPIASKIKLVMENNLKYSSNKIENVVKANVHAVVSYLAEQPSIAKLIAEKKVSIAGGYYNLGSGKVELLLP